MAAKKDKMIPSEKERKRALKYATPAGTGRMWVTMGIAFIIFGIILLLIPIGLAISAEATEWIRKQKITKALMNPPYERRYGCATIVANVLDSVPVGTKCAFILPDKKMEKESKLKALLERHTLTTIIKLPENLFFGLGVTTSIFIFETGKPQNGRNIKGYYVADDGLETVKNKGRQDVHDKWPALEDYWVKAIQDDNDDRYNTRQLINPAEHLSYQMPEKPFELYEEDFIKTVMDYEMYKRGINAKEFGDKLLQKVLYGSTVTGTEKGTNILTPPKPVRRL